MHAKTGSLRKLSGACARGKPSWRDSRAPLECDPILRPIPVVFPNTLTITSTGGPCEHGRLLEHDSVSCCIDSPVDGGAALVRRDGVREPPVGDSVQPSGGIGRVGRPASGANAVFDGLHVLRHARGQTVDAGLRNLDGSATGACAVVSDLPAGVRLGQPVAVSCDGSAGLHVSVAAAASGTGRSGPVAATGTGVPFAVSGRSLRRRGATT